LIILKKSIFVKDVLVERKLNDLKGDK